MGIAGREGRTDPAKSTRCSRPATSVRPWAARPTDSTYTDTTQCDRLLSAFSRVYLHETGGPVQMHCSVCVCARACVSVARGSHAITRARAQTRIRAHAPGCAPVLPCGDVLECLRSGGHAQARRPVRVHLHPCRQSRTYVRAVRAREACAAQRGARALRCRASIGGAPPGDRPLSEGRGSCECGALLLASRSRTVSL